MKTYCDAMRVFFHYIGCVIVMQHMCWRVAQICYIFRNYWVIQVLEPRKYIHMLAHGIYNKFVRLLMIC